MSSMNKIECRELIINNNSIQKYLQSKTFRKQTITYQKKKIRNNKLNYVILKIDRKRGGFFSDGKTTSKKKHFSLY